MEAGLLSDRHAQSPTLTPRIDPILSLHTVNSSVMIFRQQSLWSSACPAWNLITPLGDGMQVLERLQQQQRDHQGAADDLQQRLQHAIAAEAETQDSIAQINGETAPPGVASTSSPEWYRELQRVQLNLEVVQGEARTEAQRASTLADSIKTAEREHIQRTRELAALDVKLSGAPAAAAAEDEAALAGTAAAVVAEEGADGPKLLRLHATGCNESQDDVRFRPSYQ